MEIDGIIVSHSKIFRKPPRYVTGGAPLPPSAVLVTGDEWRGLGQGIPAVPRGGGWYELGVMTDTATAICPACNGSSECSVCGGRGELSRSEIRNYLRKQEG